MNQFRFFSGQDGDAQIALAISLLGICLWLLALGYNIGWLSRANGDKPFVRGILLANFIMLTLAISFTVNSSFLQSLSNDLLLRITFLGNRTIVAVAPLGLWILRRDIIRHSKGKH